MTNRKRSESACAAQRGQATVEYLVVAMGLVISLVAISAGGQTLCTKHMSGTLYAQGCQNLNGMIHAAMEKTVGEMTFLINLP